MLMSNNRFFRVWGLLLFLLRVYAINSMEATYEIEEEASLVQTLRELESADINSAKNKILQLSLTEQDDLLIVAARLGYERSVTLLLESNISEKARGRALVYACKKGHSTIVTTLLKIPIPENFINRAFDKAVKSEDVKIIRAMIQSRISEDAFDFALRNAILKEDYRTLRFLLSYIEYSDERKISAIRQSLYFGIHFIPAAMLINAWNFTFQLVFREYIKDLNDEKDLFEFVKALLGNIATNDFKLLMLEGVLNLPYVTNTYGNLIMAHMYSILAENFVKIHFNRRKPLLSKEDEIAAKQEEIILLNNQKGLIAQIAGIAMKRNDKSLLDWCNDFLSNPLQDHIEWFNSRDIFIPPADIALFDQSTSLMQFFLKTATPSRGFRLQMLRKVLGFRQYDFSHKLYAGLINNLLDSLIPSVCE